MSDPMTDGEVEELRAGLAGVTPGPWKAVEDECATCREKGESEAFISGLPGGHHSPFGNLTDAAHIARCSPDRIASLLSRLDAEKRRADEAVARPQGAVEAEREACATAARGPVGPQSDGFLTDYAIGRMDAERAIRARALTSKEESTTDGR